MSQKLKVVLAPGMKEVSSIPGTPMTPNPELTQYSDTGAPGSWSPTESGTSNHRKQGFDTKETDRFVPVTTFNGIKIASFERTGELGFSPNTTKGPDGVWIDITPYLQ